MDLVYQSAYQLEKDTLRSSMKNGKMVKEGGLSGE